MAPLGRAALDCAVLAAPDCAEPAGADEDGADEPADGVDDEPVDPDAVAPGRAALEPAAPDDAAPLWLWSSVMMNVSSSVSTLTRMPRTGDCRLAVLACEDCELVLGLWVWVCGRD
jgi:hypothetical protein